MSLHEQYEKFKKNPVVDGRVWTCECDSSKGEYFLYLNISENIGEDISITLSETEDWYAQILNDEVPIKNRTIREACKEAFELLKENVNRLYLIVFDVEKQIKELNDLADVFYKRTNIILYWDYNGDAVPVTSYFNDAMGNNSYIEIDTIKEFLQTKARTNTLMKYLYDGHWHNMSFKEFYKKKNIWNKK